MTRDFTHEFAARLRTIKAEKHLTVAEMAELSGLGKKRMENYLSRRFPTQPGLEGLARISSGLNVSLNWLILGIGPVDSDEAIAGFDAEQRGGGIMSSDRRQIDLVDYLNGAAS